MKKILFFLMVLCFCTCTNKAIGQTWNIGHPGYNSNVRATLNGNTLTISGNGNMADFWSSTEGEAPWWFNTTDRNAIQFVTIENSVTNIGQRAFKDCINLQTITIPNSVLKINGQAFYNCTSLKSVLIPESVATIEDEAFRNCTGLLSIANMVITPQNINSNVFQGVTVSSVFLVTPKEKKEIYETANVWKNFHISTPYVFFDENLGENIDAAILGIEGVDYHFQNQTGNPNLTKRITVYDNLSETINTVVEYNNEGYPERIITDDLTYIIDGYADNICTVSLLDKNGIYYSFDNIQVPQFIVNNQKKILPNLTGEFLKHISLIANSKLMTLVETMDGVTMADEIANLHHIINYNAIAEKVFEKAMIGVAIDFAAETFEWGDELKAGYLTYKLIQNGFKTKSCSAAFAAIAAIPVTASASLVAAVPLSIYCVWNVYTTTSSIGGVINAWMNVDWKFSSGTTCSVVATLDGGTLVISGDGALCQSEIDKYKPTYSNGYTDRRSEIKTLIIRGGVTSIPHSAFQVYTNLQRVRIETGSETLNFGTFGTNSHAFYSSSLGSLYLGRDISYSTSPFYGNTLLTSLEIGNQVTSINADCFRGCSELKTVIFGSKLTAIGNNAFYGCKNVTSTINIPVGVTTIGNNAFSGGEKWVSLVIPNSVESIGYSAFSGCTSLQSVRIENNGTKTLSFGTFGTNSHAFYGSSIGSLYLGRDISYSTSPFYGNTLLTSLEIGNQVTSINADCFRGCSEIKTVTFGSGLTLIGNNAFYGCKNVASVINIPAGVKSIGNQAFYGGEKWSSLVIPNSVNSIGYNAFSGCTNLQNVIIENSSEILDFGTFGTNSHAFFSSSIGSLYLGRDISYSTSPFYGNILLTSLEVGNQVTSINASCFSGCSELKTVIFGSGLTTIGNNAFYNCKSVTSSINIPVGVTTIGNNAFSGGENWVSLVIPYSVESIGYNAFSGCTSLQSVRIESNGTKTLSFGTFGTNSHAFYGSSIGSLYLGRDISYSTSPFYGNTLLTTLEIGNQVTSINADCFRGCSKLATIKFGNGLKTIGNNAFYGCDSLESDLDISVGVTSIGNYAFYNCKKSLSLVIPNTVESIGYNAFSGCTSLQSVRIENNGTKTLSFGTFGTNSHAFYGSSIGSLYLGRDISYSTSPFYGNTLLTSLTIGGQVTVIGADCFRGCTGLTQIISNATIPPTLQSNTFSNVSKTIPVYINCNYLSIYQSTQYWKDFTNYQCAVQVVPASNSVVVTFPKIDNAATYTLGIYSNESCTNKITELSLDANGNLRAVQQTLSCTVSGLNTNTQYYYSLTPYNASGNVLTIFTGDFITTNASTNVSVTGVSLNKTTLSLSINGTEQLTASVSPSNATNKNVTWSSSNTNVATVNSNGLITARASGTAIITVSTQDGNKTAQCTVTVTQASSTATLTVSPTTHYFTESGGTSSEITVTSNQSWTISSNASWLTTSRTSGSNNNTFTMTATANISTSSRSATVTVSGGGITRIISVNQGRVSAETATLSVSPTKHNFAASGGTTSIAVTSNQSWIVSRNASWLTVSPSSGGANNTFTITATANTSTSSRTATVTVTGDFTTRTISVTQAASNALSVSQETYTFAASRSTSSAITVTSNVSWTVSSNASWLTLSRTSGSNNNTFTMTATANTSTSSRSATVTVTGGGITRTISVTQSGINDDVSIDEVENAKFQVFPNPAKDEIFIKSDSQIEKVEIFSLTGNLLFVENNFNEKISVSTLPKGIYLLNVYTDKGVAVSKIVKE